MGLSVHVAITASHSLSIELRNETPEWRQNRRQNFAQTPIHIFEIEHGARQIAPQYRFQQKMALNGNENDCKHKVQNIGQR